MNMKSIRTVPSIMKTVISEFKVFMNLMIHLEGQKSKDAQVLRVRMRQNLRSIFLLIEAQINERLLFPKNKILVGSEKVIVKAIDSVRVFLKAKGKSAKKPTTWVSKDGREMMAAMKAVLEKKTAKWGNEQMQAMKIFLPTLLMRSLAKMEAAGKKKQEAGLINVVLTEKKKLNNIQVMMKKTRKIHTTVKSSETETLLKKLHAVQPKVKVGWLKH